MGARRTWRMLLGENLRMVFSCDADVERTSAIEFVARADQMCFIVRPLYLLLQQEENSIRLVTLHLFSLG